MDRKINILGLGYGNENSLLLNTLNMLEKSNHLYLRTKDHPVVTWMKKKGLSFQTFDHIYTSQDSFHLVYREIVSQLFHAVNTYQRISYAVPGHPMVAETTTQLLLDEAKDNGVEVEVHGGVSFLDIAFSRLQIDPIEGFLVLDGNLLDPSMLNPSVNLLLGQVYSRMVASDVKLTLMERYPDDYMVTIATALGVKGKEEIISLPLYELDRKAYFTNLTSVYVPRRNLDGVDE